MAKVVFEFKDNKMVISEGTEVTDIHTTIHCEELDNDDNSKSDLAALILVKMGGVISGLVMEQLAREYRNCGFHSHVVQHSEPATGTPSAGARE